MSARRRIRERRIARDEMANHPDKEPAKRKKDKLRNNGGDRIEQRTEAGKEALPADTRHFCHNRADIKGLRKEPFARLLIFIAYR